jgi:hypothetical protein
VQTRHRFFVVPAIAVALAVGAAAAGCGGHHRHDGDPEKAQRRAQRHAERLLDSVEATPEQKSRAQAQVEKVVTRAFAFKARQKQVHADLLDLWTAPKLNQKKLDRLTQRESEEMKEMIQSISESFAELHDTLDVEQRTKIAERIRRHLD